MKQRRRQRLRQCQRLLVFLLMLAVAVPCVSQVQHTFAATNYPNQFTALNQFAVGAQVGPAAFALLPVGPPDGTIIYCSDCSQTNVCIGGGTGAVASRINGAWSCSTAAGTTLALETNGILNGSQTLLNLLAQTPLVVAENGAGSVTFSCPTCSIVSLTGSGSTNTMTIWTGANSIGNSQMVQSANAELFTATGANAGKTWTLSTSSLNFGAGQGSSWLITGSAESSGVLQGGDSLGSNAAGGAQIVGGNLSANTGASVQTTGGFTANGGSVIITGGASATTAGNVDLIASQAGTNFGSIRLLAPLHTSNGGAGNNDITGELALSGTLITYSFTGKYASHPECTVTPQGDPIAVRYWVTYTGVASFSVNTNSSLTQTFSYHCVGRN